MSDGGAPQPGARLEEAVRARREAEGIRVRLEAAVRDAEQVAERSREADRALAEESQDVERLEHLSWSRILASLRGSLTNDRDREVAEQQAARYEAGLASSRLEAARRDVAALQARLDALGDVDAEYDDALAAKERWAEDHDPAAAAALAEISETRGRLLAEDTEAREAHAAGTVALEHLRRAADRLREARSWSTWDTFGGGGFLTDMMKYDRLDEVSVVLGHADLALRRFSRELADLRLAGVSAVNVDGLTRTFDVFFDNIFSDLAVRSRIQEAESRVGHTRERVEHLLRGLADRGRRITGELEDLERRREEILLGGADPVSGEAHT